MSAETDLLNAFIDKCAETETARLAIVDLMPPEDVHLAGLRVLLTNASNAAKRERDILLSGAGNAEDE